MAASRVSSIIRIGGTRAPLTSTGADAFAGHVRHGALNHVFSQVSNGAVRSVRSASADQVDQDLGHGASVHSTAR